MIILSPTSNKLKCQVLHGNEYFGFSTGFVVEQKHVSWTEEHFDSGISTLSRSVWLICFFGASPALVILAEELEQPGSDSPWVYGIPHLWRGEGQTSEIHSQTWQVRESSASREVLAATTNCSRADRFSVFLSAACVVTSGLLLNMETSCSLFVGFFKVDLKQMILRMLTPLALDSGFNFTWRPVLGFFSYFVSYCKVPLWTAWASVEESCYKSSSSPTNFICCLDMARQRLPTCHWIFSVCSKRRFLFLCVFLVTFSAWAVPAWVSGPSATSLQMGTFSRQSPTTNLFSKHWSMASGKACK